MERCISASCEPFTQRSFLLSFLAVPPNKIELTVAVPEIKGELAACGTGLQFFLFVHQLYSRKELLLGGAGNDIKNFF